MTAPPRIALALRTAQSQLDVLARRLRVHPALLAGGIVFLIFLILAVAVGLPAQRSRSRQSLQRALAQSPRPSTPTARADWHLPEPTKVAAAAASPSPAAPASPIAPASTAAGTLSTLSSVLVLLPALPPSTAPEAPAYQVAVEVPPAQAGEPYQLVGVTTESAGTASLAASIPRTMAPYVSQGQPARLRYAFDIQVPTSGAYVLTASLAGNASSSMRVQLDGRADTLLQLKRTWNAIWAPNAPAAVGSAGLALGKGRHRLDVWVDTTATLADKSAPVVDLYMKSASADVPTALVPLWPVPVATHAHASAAKVRPPVPNPSPSTSAPRVTVTATRAGGSHG